MTALEHVGHESADVPAEPAAAAALRSPAPYRDRRPLVGARFLAVTVVVAVAVAAADDYWASVLIFVSISVMVVAGLHLLVQWGGQLSLGQVAFVGVGAFTTAHLNGQWGVALPPALLLGAATAALASAVVGLPALRIRGLELAIVTFASGFAADRWLFRQDWFTGEFGIGRLQGHSFLGFDLFQPQQLLIPIAGLALVVGLATAVIGSSGFGRALRLVAQDEEVAASYGVNVGVHKFLAFTYAGLCAGFAGGALALVQSQGVAAQSFPPQHSVLYLSAVLLGGRGPVTGSLAAGGLLAAAPILWGASVGRYLDLLAPLGLFLVVRSFRGGLNDVFGYVGRIVRRGAGRG